MVKSNKITEALQESESRFHDLVQNLRVGIVLTGPDGAVRLSNPAAAEILGVPPNYLGGAHAADPKWQAFYEDGSPCPPGEHPIPRALSARRPVRNSLLGVLRPIRRDIVWLLVDADPRLGSDGSVIEVICSFFDVTERKRAEDALQENGQRFRQMVDGLQGAMALTKADLSEVLYVSPGYEQIWGRSCESLYADPTSWIEGVHPDDLPALEQELKQLQQGERFAMEHRVVRPDGSIRWVSHWGVPVRDALGQVYRFAGSVRDITDRKLAEEARHESDTRLRLLASHVPAVLWTVDANLRVTSSAGAGLKPKDREEGATVHLYDYIGTADPEDAVIAAHRRALKGETVTLDYDWRGRTCQIHLEPLPDSGVIGIAVDVTARKHAEQRAVEWKERYDAAVRATGQILYDWDVRTGHVTYSGNIESTLGYSAEEMTGGLDRWLALVHPEDRESFDAEFQRSHTSKTPAHVRYRVRTREGRYIEVQDDCSFVLDEAGKIVRAVGFVMDLSERRHLEDQLRQAQKMEAVGRLAGGVAHDFNNLLTVILGYSDALRHEHDQREASSDLDEIENAALRAELLTRQLLAFSRRQMLQMRVLDLNEIVTDTDRMLRRLIGEHIQLQTTLGSLLGRVRADAGQIQQILVNLAVNARDAMPSGGTLIIETANADLDQTFVQDHPGAVSGVYVMLAVTDNGTGMDRETQARIFEPFFTTKPPGEGTGLGLSMVYGSVKQSGGYISVYSEPGRGTTFRIYLPRVDAPAEVRYRDFTVPELVRGTETILLVEDEESVRRLIENILRSAGYAVLSATNAVEALTICRTHQERIPLMITDVVMPGMSGSELAKQARTDCPKMKVLYISGYTDDAIVQYGVLKPGVAFLAKPFTAVALTAKLRELLDSEPAPS